MRWDVLDYVICKGWIIDGVGWGGKAVKVKNKPKTAMKYEMVFGGFRKKHSCAGHHNNR